MELDTLITENQRLKLETRQLSAQLAGVRKVAEDRGEEIAELKDLLNKVEYWKNECK